MWQPIETAPKDGSSILLSSPKGRRIADGFWNVAYQEWSWPYVMVGPTRWMPLPEDNDAQAQPAPSVPVLTPAARDILGERRRQIEVEGWTPLHDDAHAPGDLSSAAMGYAQSAACKLSHEGLALEGLPLFWPWEASWFKPSTARQDLVKAGALILAELERLDRAAAPEAK